MQESQNHIERWNACLKIIEQIIDPQKFQTWFLPIKPVSFEDGKLTVEVPSDFFREFLEGAFLDIIKVTLRKVIGPDAKLVYMVKPVSNAGAMKYPAAESLAPVNKSISLGSIQPFANANPFLVPGLRQITINPRLNPDYCFANMIVGSCNKMGITAGESISMAPGKTAFNPLLIFGGSGLGKTHLAQAIGISIKEKFPEQIVLYITANEFKTQFMDAVNVKNKLTDFLAYYSRMDVLIVDDIQDLLGQGTQHAFFHVFNHLHQNGKQLIFTSDRPPAELQNFEERLLSRFKWGLSVELKKPDYETRLAMLKSRCFREGVNLGDDVIEYLASRVKSNFRELEGAFVSLMAHSTLTRQENTISLAQQITEKLVCEEQSELTIDKVQDIVCEYFNLSRETLVSKSRKRQIVQARQIAMYMCRNHITNCSLSTIGSEIGGKDHATVLHACSTVSDLMSTDRVFKQYVLDIEKILVPVEN